jgi:hypothetical protein
VFLERKQRLLIEDGEVTDLQATVFMAPMVSRYFWLRGAVSIWSGQFYFRVMMLET